MVVIGQGIEHKHIAHGVRVLLAEAVIVPDHRADAARLDDPAYRDKRCVDVGKQLAF